MRTLAPPAGRGYEYLTGSGWDFGRRAGRAARTARGQAGRALGPGRALRPGDRPVQPVAHHPRVDRSRHRARPGPGLRGRLRRDVVRHPGQARQPALRLAASCTSRRPDRRERPGHRRLRRRGRGRAVLGPGQRRHPDRLPARPADGAAQRLRALQRLRVRRRPEPHPDSADGERVPAARAAAARRPGPHRRRAATASTSSATRAGRSTCSGTTSSSPASASSKSPDGRLAGQLADVAYQATTTEFWGAMEAVGGPETYVLGGAFNCGKGQPGQVAPVSHGCPAALLRGEGSSTRVRRRASERRATTAASAAGSRRAGPGGRRADGCVVIAEETSSGEPALGGNTLTTNGVARPAG